MSDADRKLLTAFFAVTRVLPIGQPVLDRAVSLRLQRKMSLGDSLVAGTALLHGLELVTRNVGDFRWVEGLSVVDPIAPPIP